MIARGQHRGSGARHFSILNLELLKTQHIYGQNKVIGSKGQGDLNMLRQLANFSLKIANTEQTVAMLPMIPVPGATNGDQQRNTVDDTRSNDQCFN